MTQTRFVEYGSRGFWAYDVALGIFLKYLIDAASHREEDPTRPWLADAVAWWRIVACVSDYGLSCDPEWSSDQLATFVELTDEACAQLALREVIEPAEVASWHVLDDQTIFLRNAAQVRTSPIVELGLAIRALVTGSLPDAPPGASWLYGSPDGRKTIAMRAPP